MKRLTILGFFLTAVLLLAFGAAIYLKSSAAEAMALNEWGDFIAGAFAPLALLWLVIGYFQHGEELRLNTEALRMQQMELQRQVEETAHLVEAANRQALAAQQDLQHRQEREAREAEPEFILGTSGSFSSEQATIYLQNRGGEARDVSLHYDGPYQFKFRPRPYIESNGTANFSFASRGKQPLDYPIRFRITSTDRLSHRHNQDFEFSRDRGLVRV